MNKKKLFDALAKNISILGQSGYPLSISNTETVIRPFYASLITNHKEEYIIEVEDGGVMIRGKSLKTPHFARQEMRVGDPEKGGVVSSQTLKLPDGFGQYPTDLQIWRKANDALRFAVSNYQETNASVLGLQEKRDKFTYFSQGEEIIRDTQETPKKLPRDFKDIEEMLLQVTDALSHPDLHRTHGYLNAYILNKAFVNTEGTSYFNAFQRFSITIGVEAVDQENLVIPNRESFHVLDPTKFPTLDELLEVGDKLTKELLDTINAPTEKNGAYPVVLDPENHGVLWHEVVGHALEGHRMQEDRWRDKTTLFKNRIGEMVAPDFLTLIDDPTIEGMDGSYKYDEEGVRAQRVVLIENGRLRNYLQSRQSAGYHKTQSNGHARAQDCDDPTPRMSNLFITSSHSTSYESLIEDLKKLVRDTPGVEYGLILENSMGGFTLPEECYFNEFPKNVFRLYPDGKKERVKPVFVVGTPLVTLQNIVKTSDEYETFNGTCGAESGWIPSTETAPHALISSLEVNPVPKSTYNIFYSPVIPKPKK